MIYFIRVAIVNLVQFDLAVRRCVLNVTSFRYDDDDKSSLLSRGIKNDEPNSTNYCVDDDDNT